MERREDPLAGTNLAFIEGLYANYLEDPSSVDGDWQSYFASWAAEDGDVRAARSAVTGPSFPPSSIFDPPGGEGLSVAPARGASRQEMVNRLIHAYRVRGHLKAALDPLGRPHTSNPELELGHWGLSENDLDSLFSTTAIAGATALTLRQVLELLEDTYCRSIGVQFMHIDDVRAKNWLIERLEDPKKHRHLNREEKLRILTKLTDAELFEQFIHKKFLGAKRFSLEGAETLIPLVDLALEEAGAQGVEEVVLGMAHRGRLNVLVNIMGKSPREVFREFSDEDPDLMIGRGDVKYHLGFSSDRETADGHRMHLSLCFNPSHLEFVNPVLQGRVRAKQERFGDTEHRRCLGILIHGDAAFAGQGVIQELFNMANLPGYRTGGTLHVIVNNQIGFTTSPEKGRSTHYATDVARMLQTPVFHVNGEDPDAVAQVVRTAMDYRREFQQDVIIDMYCYRRYGHNEGDEPSYTQPLLYEVIRKRKTVRESYLDYLLGLGGIDREEAEKIRQEQTLSLEDELSKAQDPEFKLRGPRSGEGLWHAYRGGADGEVPEVPRQASAKTSWRRCSTRVRRCRRNSASTGSWPSSTPIVRRWRRASGLSIGAPPRPRRWRRWRWRARRCASVVRIPAAVPSVTGMRCSMTSRAARSMSRWTIWPRGKLRFMSGTVRFRRSASSASSTATASTCRMA